MVCGHDSPPMIDSSWWSDSAVSSYLSSAAPRARSDCSMKVHSNRARPRPADAPVFRPTRPTTGPGIATSARPWRAGDDRRSVLRGGHRRFGPARDSPPDHVRIDPLHIGSLITKSRDARRIAVRDCHGDLNHFHRSPLQVDNDLVGDRAIADLLVDRVARRVGEVGVQQHLFGAAGSASADAAAVTALAKPWPRCPGGVYTGPTRDIPATTGLAPAIDTVSPRSCQSHTAPLTSRESTAPSLSPCGPPTSSANAFHHWTTKSRSPPVARRPSPDTVGIVSSPSRYSRWVICTLDFPRVAEVQALTNESTARTRQPTSYCRREGRQAQPQPSRA